MNADAQMSDSQDAAGMPELHVSEGRKGLVRGQEAGRTGARSRKAGAPKGRKPTAANYELLGRGVWVHLRNTATLMVAKAVKDGRLISLQDNHVVCTDCDARATSYDHRDYSRPLDVEPVCHYCNHQRGKAELDFARVCDMLTRGLRD